MKPEVIDVHSHHYPRWYIELLKARTDIPRVIGDPGDERFVIFPGEAEQTGGRPISPDYWDLDAKFKFMAAAGIDRAVLSLGNPWLDPLDADTGLEAARRSNAYFAELGERPGGRVAGMGVLPPGDVRHAVTVVGEIASTASLHGIVSGTRICGQRLDDPDLEPLWEVLERTRVPLLVHPHYGIGGDELAGFGHALPVAVGFPFETTLAVARLVFAGVLHRHPMLKVVASHGGGTLPYLAGRLDASWRSDPSVHGRLPEAPSDSLKRLFLDAVLYHARALRAAADLVGVDRLAFGTDHPFSVADPARNLAAIREAFDADESEHVLAGAARALFDLEGGPG